MTTPSAMQPTSSASSADLAALFKELMNGHIGRINTGHTFEVSDDLIARIEAAVAIVPQVVQAPICKSIDNGYGNPMIATLTGSYPPIGTLLYAAPIVATVPSEQKPIAMIDPERIETLYGPIGACAVHATLYQSGMTYNDKATMALYAAPSPTEQASDVRNQAFDRMFSDSNTALQKMNIKGDKS